MSIVSRRLFGSIRTAVYHFNRLSQRQPVVSAMLTTTTIATCGDIASQYYTHRYQYKPFHWDYRRTAKYGFYGLLIAPQMVQWYYFLNRFFPSHSAKTAVKRVCVDQVLWASYSITFSLGVCCALSGGNFHDIRHQLRTKWFDTYLACAMYWPPFTLFMFMMIPPHLQVLWLNVVSLGWSAFMSHQALG